MNEELVKWDKNTIKPLGEFVVVVGGSATELDDDPDEVELAVLFGQIEESTSLAEDMVLAMVAGNFHISPVRARKLLKKGRILQKRAKDNQQDL